jgi:hypothetical protein
MRNTRLYLCAGLLVAIFSIGFLAALQGSATGGIAGFISQVLAANITSTVTVGNAAPTVTNVILNNGGAITLTANTTTNVNVNATINDNNGCGDITPGTTTIMIYRSGITSSTCLTTSNDLNCYRATAFTASSTCIGTTINTTTTFAVQYFADATDSSSSYSSQNWVATVIFKDVNSATGTGDSTGQELNTLNAINVTTSSINYGTLAASSTSGGTNQVATTSNAGNSSTTLQLKALQTLVSGSNSIATSSQRYSTSSFTFPGTSTALTESLVTVSGFLLVPPTSTSLVQRPTFWGLEVPAGTPTGTYNGINVFSALWQQ